MEEPPQQLSKIESLHSDLKHAIIQQVIRRSDSVKQAVIAVRIYLAGNQQFARNITQKDMNKIVGELGDELIPRSYTKAALTLSVNNPQSNTFLHLEELRRGITRLEINRTVERYIEKKDLEQAKMHIHNGWPVKKFIEDALEAQKDNQTHPELDFLLDAGVGHIQVEEMQKLKDLCLCICKDDRSNAQRIINSGLNINRIYIGSSSCLFNPQTPLQLAVKHNRAEILWQIIAAGAILNRKNERGQTVMHFAASGRSECLKILIEAGADLNCQDKDGFTPIMEAVLAGNAHNCKILYEAGAHVTIANSLGKTAHTLGLGNFII